MPAGTPGQYPTGHTVERGFFAVNDKKLHREVAVYENGAHVSHRRQTWVFGHLGKQHGGAGPDAAAMAPDPARAGWVPLRVLKVT